ncbi:MAG: L,D-transpeptidase ErfK/SrfK [Solirubrobacteraceae bacterium]|jgi:lipoprotein-anchoring transpeptidase ErfK/SrfK|nr:L,D-transpeptidase ErfK/SrfK [Solirubrobacteraceae bacterium]
MRSKSFIAMAVVLVVLLAAAGGVYAYDSSREDLIASGVTIGGVDVGGMRAATARERLRSELLTPLARPVVARWKHHQYTLTPKAAGVGVDIDRAVSTAVARSRAGGIIDRTFRGLTGARVHDALAVSISYDHDAVARVVGRVRKALDRPAKDATVSFDGGQISRTPSRIGLQVVAGRLERDLARRLTSRTASREVTVHARTLSPKVSDADLGKKYPSVIIVNRGAFTLHLYHDLQPQKDYRVAVGMAGLETPQGLYTIQDKQTNPYWHVPDSAWAGSLAGKVIPPGPQNPIKARWMGIYNGAGIHGTSDIGSLGSAASHGCIRMAIPDVEDLFDRVDVGTPVYIL